MENHSEFGGLEQLLTEHQAAQVLGISAKTLRNDRWLRRMGVPYVAVGSAVRYAPSDLRRWIDDRRRTPTAKPAAKPRAGRPTRAEQIEAAELGLSVRELRARTAGGVE